MFKFLLVLLLVGYLFFKIGGFLFKLVLGRTVKAAQERQYRQNTKGKTSKEGINIDHIPDQKGKRTGGNYKGGEYIDYEDV